MTASLRILTTSSLDSDPSVLIVSPDGSKTLVNCGEGCQRSFLESSAHSAGGRGISALRVGSVKRVCLTHTGHDSLGGLPGMILTTADAVETIARELRGSKTNGGFTAAAAVNNDAHDGNKNYRRGENRKGGRLAVGRNKHQQFGSLISDDPDGGCLPDLDIVGPEGTRAFLHSLRHFMRRDRFRVRAHEGWYDSSTDGGGASVGYHARKRARKRKKIDKEKISEENGFGVRSIPVSYNTYEHPKKYHTSDFPLSSLPIKRQAVSYLFTTSPIPGKFLVHKAQALNVPKGPMYGQLKAGKSVTFIDPETNEKRTVKSEEVVARNIPGAGVAVVYCPSLEVLDRLMEDQTLCTFEVGPKIGKENLNEGAQLDVMVHLTPELIFEEPAYQSWCKKFGVAVDHITLHAVDTLASRVMEENSPFVSGICGGIRRSFIHSKLFPMPLINLPSGQCGGQAKKCCNAKELTTIQGCPMMEYVLMPRSRRGLNEATLKTLYSKNTINELREKVNESGAAESAFAIANFTQYSNGSGPGELIFTGTGSAIPCKHRNVTGMYLRMNNSNGILLDVGEGTVGQLLRSWQSTIPPDQASIIDEFHSRLKGIKAVWISHPHADHHLGLLRFLAERAAICGMDDPIVLMAPSDMFDFLAEYQSVVPGLNRSYIAVDCRDMIHGRENPLGRRLYEELGITYCASVPVAHCARSYALKIAGTPFGKLAYSGDCRPSTRFADMAFGADLLIHEATFEDGMEEDAVLKRHSTVGEAIDVASKMNARSLVLTHFSQRYPKIPLLNMTKDKMKIIPIAFAFDFMRLTPGTIKLAAELTPALRLLYPRESGDEAEINNEKVIAKELLAVPGVFAAKGVL